MSEKEVEEDKRQVSTVGLMLIAFFWVGGGIYGNEPMIQAAPTGVVTVMLAGCAILYALPMALISAELATALPYDGGLVAWVEETCGALVGLHNMYWLWISYLFDSAAYPVLAAGYGAQAFDLKVFNGSEETGEAILATIIIGVITLMKLGGTDYVVKASGFFFVASLLPTIIFTVYGSKDLKVESLTDFDIHSKHDPHGWKPTVIFSWITWLNCGFNSIGALAGEIKNPKKTYPVVVGTLIPLCVIMYIWPILVCVSRDDNRTAYEPGHFNNVAEKLAGQWLGILFIIGAAFCFIGNYNAQIIVCERSVASFFEASGKEYLQKRKRWLVTRYLLQENGTGVAPIYIILNAGLASLLVWLPYDALIEFSMLQMCLNVFLFMYAFVYYKWKMPELDRPFSVPGGLFGAIATAFPVLVISGVVGYYAVIDSTPIFGLPYAKLLGLVVLTGIGVVIHLLYCTSVAIQKKCCRRRGSAMYEPGPPLKALTTRPNPTGRESSKLLLIEEASWENTADVLIPAASSGIVN